MRNILAIILIAALGILFVSCGNPLQREAGVENNSAEDPQDCDNYAAHPGDTMRYAPGKSDEEIVGVLALRACTTAVKRFPGEARFHFQLGRALLALRQATEAAKEFEIAASMNYGPAKYYCAQAKLNSYFKDGPESDYVEAIKLLEEVKETFEPAAKRYDEVVFSSDGFQNPRIVEAFYLGDTERLNTARILVAFYTQGFQDFLSIDFHPVAPECPAIMVDSSINYNLDSAVVGDPRDTLERWGYDLMFIGAKWAGKIFLDPTYKGDPEKWREYYKNLGKRDAYFLANKFGCQSPVSRKVYAGLIQFAKAKRPLIEYAEDLSKGRGRDLFLISSEATNEE